MASSEGKPVHQTAGRTSAAVAAVGERRVANIDSSDFMIQASTEELQQSVLRHLKLTLARDDKTATARDWWISAAMTVRDYMLERMIKTQEKHNSEDVRRVYYLSLEYLMGRLFRNNAFNAGIYAQMAEALSGLGLDIETLEREEVDMGLGNGGLGRLAACFIDSMASLNYPAIAYGIRYEFGLFRQEFVDGHQVEYPDNWLQFSNPWEIMRPEYTVPVKLYGRVESHFDENGDFRPRWVDAQTVIGLPYDIPILGYGGETVNFLRLWSSKTSEELDLSAFNSGGYVEAVQDKAISETISKVLYPNDKTESGKRLRLVQQYFFVSCSLVDTIRRYLRNHDDWDAFPEKVAIQLNDTHPAVAIPELMRLLVDEYRLSWEYAWALAQRVFGYTNHTLLPEALEKWSVPLFGEVLPRHLEIVYEINRRFLEEVVEARWPGDDRKKQQLSIVEEGKPKMLRMAYLSVVAAHSTNGVAELHTKLLKRHIFRGLNELYPERFNSKTNGITPRRWLLACNPALSELVTEAIGDQWPIDLDQLEKLEEHVDDPAFRERFMAVKRENKERLTSFIAEQCGITVSPDAVFDVQIKRLHEYKRQHLNLLHILTLYRRLLHNPDLDIAPRVFIFGAKAAPGYDLAKNIILAINSVGQVINSDSRINGKLKVVFLPNYGVSVAERIIPAADVSEQISTAGKEASGTGNMKLALNGAVTLGTLDGANVEIRDCVGEENVFIFGLTEEQVEETRARGYRPHDFYRRDPELRNAIDWLSSDYFTPREPNALAPVVHSLLDGGDPFLVCADYRAYVDAQERIGEAYQYADGWARMAALNTARVGFFSSDRTIREYAREVWNLEPVRVPQ